MLLFLQLLLSDACSPVQTPMPCPVEPQDVSACSEYNCVVQMLHVQAEGSGQPETFESLDGIAPAMRNARKRHFNNAYVDPQEVKAVEDDLLQLASVRKSINSSINLCTRQSA